MTSTDAIALFAVAISAVAIIVSIWAVMRSSKFSDYQIRLSNRAELHKILLEIDREILHDPSLYAMFRWKPADMEIPTSPLDIAKQDIYVAMYLNMFELSFAYFKELRNLTTAEQEVSEAWDCFIKSFFQDCYRAKATWLRFRETYYTSFRVYIDALILQVEAEGEIPTQDDKKLPNQAL